MDRSWAGQNHTRCRIKLGAVCKGIHEGWSGCFFTEKESWTGPQVVSGMEERKGGRKGGRSPGIKRVGPGVACEETNVAGVWAACSGWSWAVTKSHSGKNPWQEGRQESCWLRFGEGAAEGSTFSQFPPEQHRVEPEKNSSRFLSSFNGASTPPNFRVPGLEEPTQMSRLTTGHAVEGMQCLGGGFYGGHLYRQKARAIFTSPIHLLRSFLNQPQSGFQIKPFL